MKLIKYCPVCGAPLVIRTNRETEEQFLGCSQYPNCKHSEPLPESMKLMAMGAQMLPGFE